MRSRVVLPAAVGAGQPDPLARADLERHPVQDRFGAEMLAKILNLQKNHSFAPRIEGAVPVKVAL